MKRQNIFKKVVCGFLIAMVAVTSVGVSFSPVLAAEGNYKVNDRNKTGIYYTNLKDKESREKLTSLMKKAGIAPKRQNIFWIHVNQFNNAVPKRMLVDGMTKYKPKEPKYDPYKMQEYWEKKYMDYLGQNCRLTATTLFGDYFQVKNKKLLRDDFLFLDKDSAKHDPWVLKNKIKNRWWLSGFRGLYSTVPTKATKNVKTHVSMVKKDWKKRGITFKKNKNASLISVFFHDNLDGNNLFVGHTGILFKDGKNLWFLEKIAFQEPYQLTKFHNRKELNKYLMEKYDVEENQPTAAPFIMENDNLMTGYGRMK